VIPAAAAADAPTVAIVDDDVSIRESLELLIRWAGWRSAAYGSAGAFLAAPPPRGPGCLLLDLELPDLDGLEVQARLAAERPELPIVFLTAHADIPRTVRAMKAGAAEFLTKPFADAELLVAIGRAIERSRTALEQASEAAALRARYQSLTPREREVMGWVVAGRLNKQVAAALGTREITIKTHRAKVMHKMGAGSFADLVRMAARLGVPLPSG
jgi:FixJ family two-component response regulator